jgi:hypothetical protein
MICPTGILDHVIITFLTQGKTSFWSVSIVKKTMGWRIGVQFPDREGIFLFTTTFRPASYPIGTEGSLPRGRVART